MASEHPGYEKLVQEISSLFSGHAPPFLYINDPISPRTTAQVVNSVLSSIARSPDASCRVYHAQVNAVACFNPRILYDTVLNQLARWNVKWADGCKNWSGEGDQRWNDNLDGFFHGLKAVHSHIFRGYPTGSNKGKSKETDADLATDIGQTVIVVERAERLPEQMPDLLVPLARLAELTQLDLSVIFVSDVPWEDMRPPFGGSPDPYYVDVLPLSKEDLLRRLSSSFQASEHAAVANPYHPSLRPLYSQYLSVLLDSCSLYVQDPNELQYIAAARWPGFVKPILDAHNNQRPDPDGDVDMDGGTDDESTLKPPTEDVRMRLIRIFKPSFRAALETLYPRLNHAAHWAASNDPEPNLLSKPPRETQPLPDSGGVAVDDGRIADLPRMSKFILVAAYLASTNPQTSDVRMFGRATDEKKRKRRAYKATTKSGTAKAKYTIPGEHTDMEIARVGIYNTIIELSDIGLLRRTSAAEKLDGPSTFKCGVSSCIFQCIIDVVVNSRSKPELEQLCRVSCLATWLREGTLIRVSWCQGNVLSSSEVGIGDGLNTVEIFNEEARERYSSVDDRGISFWKTACVVSGCMVYNGTDA
ncbi:Origin recognition complex subunit 5 [Mycena venus]|uniref:Origin recognition complex subunit 5 n=1 Tax=Mycena venus TaxID=2733690 RepID=A0A8H7DDQ0_9AGAR|nr:Origin recognition complex subunit 5 [Mycena venus]